MSEDKNGRVAFLGRESTFFTLDEHMRVMPIHANSVLEQASRLACGSWGYQTMLPGSILVSSTFLGICTSYSLSRSPLPMVFETMIFVGGEPKELFRFATIDDCVRRHHDILDELEQQG